MSERPTFEEAGRFFSNELFKRNKTSDVNSNRSNPIQSEKNVYKISTRHILRVDE